MNCFAGTGAVGLGVGKDSNTFSNFSNSNVNLYCLLQDRFSMP